MNFQTFSSFKPNEVIRRYGKDLIFLLLER
jgi:hypothetical protein